MGKTPLLAPTASGKRWGWICAESFPENLLGKSTGKMGKVWAGRAGDTLAIHYQQPLLLPLANTEEEGEIIVQCPHHSSIAVSPRFPDDEPRVAEGPSGRLDIQQTEMGDNEVSV